MNDNKKQGLVALAATIVLAAAEGARRLLRVKGQREL